MKIEIIIITFIFLFISCKPESQNIEAEAPVTKTKETASIDIAIDDIKSKEIKEPPKPAKVIEPKLENNLKQKASDKIKSATDFTELSANSLIAIEEFNEAYLISLVRKGINHIRQRRGAPKLQLDEVLNDAARDHNIYQIKKNKLTHEQNIAQKHKAMDRVKRYGGNFRMVGENVQYQGLSQMTTGNRTEIIPETYQEMANKMIKNWVESPGHYDNLIEAEFTEDGMAIGWNPENYAFFATHVFGSRR